MSYSEKELLMLSNFVYLPACESNQTISDILKVYEAPGGGYTAESVSAAGVGGGLDSDQVSQLFTMMKEECSNNQGFGDLSASRRLEEKDVRGICFTNSKDQEPVVVFRGTGGTKEAWKDNMYGGFKTDTRIQKTASDFVKYECSTYSDITVTGHSKGGNLSQYVTITNGDKVARCISFDGQGMNADFIEKNAESIATNSVKIKSISAYNDFVNILLTCIAGEVMYVKNEKSGINAHSSFYLLKSNEYDSNGNFVSKKNKSPVTAAMQKVTDEIVNVLGYSDETDNMIVGGILGEAIASLMDVSEGEDKISNVIDKTANEVMLAFSLKMKTLFDDPDAEVKALPSGGVYFDYSGVMSVADMYGSVCTEASSLIGRTEEIKDSIDFDLASRFYTDIALARIVEDMGNVRNKISGIESVLEESANLYAAKEQNIYICMHQSG